MNQMLPTESPSREQELQRAREPKLDAGAGNLLPIPLERAYKSASSNFYWIAVLSLVNSVIAAFGGGVQFVMGLGITQLLGAIASLLAQEFPASRPVFLIIGLIMSAGMCGLFALIGFAASRQTTWPIVLGMVLYGLDALLVLAFPDWLGFAFHLFFLWQIWAAHKVIRQLQAANPAKADSFPSSIGTT